MTMKNLAFTLCVLFLFSCSKDETTVADWTGAYLGELEFVEVMVSDGSVYMDSGELTLTISAGPNDDEISFGLDGVPITRKIDGNKVDLAGTMGPDYTDDAGTMTLDGDRVTIDWQGTYLNLGEPYSTDTYRGTFTRQ